MCPLIYYLEPPFGGLPAYLPTPLLRAPVVW